MPPAIRGHSNPRGGAAGGKSKAGPALKRGPVLPKNDKILLDDFHMKEHPSPQNKRGGKDRQRQRETQPQRRDRQHEELFAGSLKVAELNSSPSLATCTAPTRGKAFPPWVLTVTPSCGSGEDKVR